MQTQTSNTLHNAIMEAGGKDHPLMLAPDKVVPVSEGSPQTTTETYMENYKNVSQDIRDQLNAEAEAVQIILTWIDKDINSTVDACPNACKISQKAATRNRGKAIVNSPPPIYDQEPSMVAEDDEMSKDKEIDKLMALISLSFKKIYKPTNNKLQTSSNTSRANQDNSPRINRGAGYDNQRLGNVVGARETVEQADWRDDTDDESKDRELEAHYMNMAQIQEVSPYAADSGPIFDAEPLQKVQNNDNYNVFAIECKHPEKSKYVHDTYPIEQDEHNVIIDSLDMSYVREQIDQNDDDDDLANKRKLLASLVEKLKCEIDDSKNHNKFLETSNKAQIKLYKTREDKELDKGITLENKVKVLDNIVYKTSQSVQTMNMLNSKCQTSFAKPEFLKKAQRANPRLYDIDCYNDNLALVLAPESDEVIRLKKESRSKFSNLIIPFDYDKLNNLYDFFVPQREKSSEQRYFSERSRMSHTPINNGNLKECFNKQTTLLEKRMDESIPWDQKCKSSKELLKIKRSVGTIFDGVEQKFHVCLKEEMVDDLRYFNSLELEVDSLKSQLETQKTQFLNEIDRLSREYYYADHMSATLGVYSELDEVTNLQYSLERKDFSKSKSVTKNNVSNDFSKPVTAQILPTNKKSNLKNTNVLAPGMYKIQTKLTQTRTTQLPNDFRNTNKCVPFSTGVIPTTSISRPQLKSNPIEDRVMLNNSQEKKQEVEDQRRNVKFSKNKTFVTACNDSLKAKSSNVNFVYATCGKCVLNVKHDMCVLKSRNGVNSRTKMPITVPVGTREPKRIVKQSVAKPLRKTNVSESNQKPRHTNRKLYENVIKTCSWWYPKFTAPGYDWKPKSKIGNINQNVSMPLGNASRIANILEPMTPRRSTVSKTTLYSNSFAARRDYPIHRRLWVPKAHNEKSQASN
nr:hypothetical protein [Tanacetum cinerariifolium]